MALSHNGLLENIPARNMYASEHIKNMLVSLGRKHAIIELDTKSVERFDMVIRTELPFNKKGYGAQCKSWIDAFSNITKSSWIAKKRNELPMTVQSGVVYNCQHQHCKATISIKMKPNTVDTDPHKGLDTEIKIGFKHSHQTYIGDSCCASHMPDVTKMKFINYFKEGMDPLAAKQYHKKLTESNGDADVLENRLYNPPSCQVYYLFEHWRAHNGIIEAVQKIKQILKEESLASSDSQIKQNLERNSQGQVAGNYGSKVSSDNICNTEQDNAVEKKILNPDVKVSGEDYAPEK